MTERSDESGDDASEATLRASGVDDVRATYDRIAEHFSETRAYPWPEVESFVADCPDGGVGLDVGCGNGRHAELLAERCRTTVGLDVSRELLHEAADRLGHLSDVTLVQADAAALPLADDSVTVAVYVATLHHLGSRAARRRSLDELARILAEGGRAIVSAWSVAADRFDRESGFDTTVDWTLPGGETVGRFYHIYDRDEFAADLAASDLVVDEVFVSSGNCYAHCRT